jgi:hypothetical protein
VNPDHPSDRVISAGDWVQGRPGVSNAQQVRQALEALKDEDVVVVPVWDATEGTGNNARYRVANYARVQLVNYRLARDNRISAQFLEYVQCEGQGTVRFPPQVTIELDSGMFTNTVRIRYALHAPLATDPMHNIGLFFALNATYLDGSPAQPQQPYRVTVTYDQADVPDQVHAHFLGLYAWKNDRWVKERSSAVDVAADTITAQPDHFGLWAVLAEQHTLYLPVILK